MSPGQSMIRFCESSIEGEVAFAGTVLAFGVRTAVPVRSGAVDNGGDRRSEEGKHRRRAGPSYSVAASSRTDSPAR